jgi:putative spermidine/putrescine transport system substrate-binding protein
MYSKRIVPGILILLVIAAAFGGCKGRETPANGTTTATTAPAPAREITVLSYGGEFAAAQRAAYFDPFEKETGIRVKDVPYNGEYGKLKGVIQSGNVAWDVMDIEASALIRGMGDNLYEPIDYGVIDKTDLIPQAIHSHAVATDFYSVSLGWNTKSIPADRAPRSWSDFWDARRLPGARSMKKDARFTLEIALLADGVPPADVYKKGQLDVDRAFRSLDRIRKNVKVWWTTGQQPIQLLSQGEVVMAAAFGARIWNAQHKDNLPVATTWAQDIIDTEYWAVPRGAKNRDAALRFIAFASRADRQAEFAKQIPLGPVNRKAFDHLPADFAKDLNTHPDNLQNQVFLNAEWWAANEAAVSERFNKWLGAQ